MGMPLATVAGRKVYYELHGEAAEEPLVLLSSMAGSCKGWLALQVPEFAPVRRSLIFEHRGVGESEDPGGPFTTADLADVVGVTFVRLGRYDEALPYFELVVSIRRSMPMNMS